MALQLPQMLGADSGNYTPETLARRRKLAETMLGNATGIQDIRHPLQGLAQMLQAGVGGYHMKQADEKEAAERERANKMFAEILAQGSDADMSALMGAAGDPWASDANQRLAQILMGEQLKQNDPLYQQNLERGGLEIEQLRNPEPEPGFEIVTPDELATMPNLDPNGAYQRGPDNRIYEIGGGGQTINVGGNNDIGTIPQGMMVTRDEAGNVTGMQPIPGGPAALEAEALADKGAMVDDRKDTATDTITGAAEIARGLAQEGGTTGVVGLIQGFNPESNAAELRRQTAVLTSVATIENLNQMRQSSPTGGALGNVTEGEGKMLAAAAGALDPDASPEQYKRALDNYEKTLLRIVHGQTDGDRIFQETRGGGSGGQSTDDPADIDALLELYK